MRAFAFVRSVLVVIAAGVVVPVALTAASQWRFGGSSPFHGMSGPHGWSAGGLRSLLAAPLTDRTLADVAVRVALVVAWCAVAVFIVTVVAEMVHMVRHGGHHLPDVRCLRWSQRSARTVAVGLVALLPMLSHGSAATAGVGQRPLLVRHAPVATVTTMAQQVGATAPRQEDAVASVAGEYVVRTGDSVFGIASRLAGPDDEAVAGYAERILDLNLGRAMTTGERFTNPGLIDVGWVLRLPPADPAASDSATSVERHIVTGGESLWSIADDELGDPLRWPELFELNAHRTFDDGRTFDDPSLLRPGWDLVVSTPVNAPVPAPAAATVSVSDHDAQHQDHPAPASVNVDQPAGTEIAGSASTISAETAVEQARPENLWASDDEPRTRGAKVDESHDEAAPQLLTLRRGVMLAGGVLTLVAVRRRRRLREAAPRSRLPEPSPHVAAIEREMREAVVGERIARVDLAARAAALSIVESEERLLAVLVSADGTIEIVTTGPVALPSMWHGAADRWTLPASVPLETIASDARRVNSPFPTLVQLGVDEGGRDVFVELEALGALEIGGGQAQRDAIVAAIAATLAGSVLAEVTTLVSVGVTPDAFLGHRLHTEVPDVDAAIDLARAAVGTLAATDRPVWELRARGTGGESWDPAVVLVGSDAGPLRAPVPQPGVAFVSASPIEGPSSTLRPDGETWVLRPLGLRLIPIGLAPDDLSAIGELVSVATVDAVIEPDPDRTIYPAVDVGPDDSSLPPARPTSGEWDLMVRLFGPVVVVDRAGDPVVFERSKTTELVAWLATHRERSTRSNARSALWEQAVRDATFANVVSEARRSLARRVAPPAGEEWVGRTLTEALPLHVRVVTDADMLARALAAARGQAPVRAIELLRQPVDSIAGLPFEGTSYLWPDGEGLTSNLTLLATSAAVELATHCLAVGDIEGVFEATDRGLRVLPGHEELIGLRMRAHARAGDHAAVRREWNGYERVVNADPWSDGEPSPKLVDLRKELLHPGV